MNGFRNKELRDWLFPEIKNSKDVNEQKRFSGKTTRRIKLLRFHGLIRKVPRENRYVLTEKGQTIATVFKCTSAFDIEKLMKIAV